MEIFYQITELKVFSVTSLQNVQFSYITIFLLPRLYFQYIFFFKYWIKFDFVPKKVFCNFAKNSKI